MLCTYLLVIVPELSFAAREMGIDRDRNEWGWETELNTIYNNIEEVRKSEEKV